MNCPKCDYEQESANVECFRCGLIIEKAFNKRDREEGRLDAVEHNEKEITGFTDESVMTPVGYILYVKDGTNPLFLGGRLVVFVFLFAWGWNFILTPIENNYAGESFMHLVNLPFHEAGHVFFRPFGKFITSLGGSLGQLLVPLTCGSVLLIQTRDTFGAAVCLWWLGQNFIDMAPYINDARALQLPLLGGNFGYSSPYGFHDFEFLLTESGLLKYDHFLAGSALLAGTLLMMVSYVWAAVVLFRQYKKFDELEGR